MEDEQNTKMKLITVHMPEKWVKLINCMVKDGLYPNRSELIRDAVRDILKYEGVFAMDEIQYVPPSKSKNKPALGNVFWRKDEIGVDK